MSPPARTAAFCVRGGAVAASFLAALSSAGAQTVAKVDLLPPSSLVAGDPSLVAASPTARGAATLRAAVFSDYAHAPLRLVTPSQRIETIVEQQFWLHGALSYSLYQRWLFGLRVPALLAQTGVAEPFAAELPAASAAAALGDPELVVRGRLLGPANGFALGIGTSVTLPLATRPYAGAPATTIRPFLAAGHQDNSSFSAFQVGYVLRSAQTLPGQLPTRAGPALTLAAAAGVMLDRARSTRLGPEISASTATSHGAKLLDPRSTVGELLVHLQHRLQGGPFEIGIAAGTSVGQAPGAADFRAILSLSWSPEEPMPPPDADEDSVPDETDMCPALVGEPSNDPLMQGCPALPSDADGDGIPDTLDACPRTIGEVHLQRKLHGCPETKPAPASVVEQPPPKATLEETQISISEQILFETGNAVLRGESWNLLEQVARILRDHPEIEACEVAGHTDDTGTPEQNLQLSRARASSVVDFLAQRGVARERLSSQGYGQTRPVADNASEIGRSRNRRVEFSITRRRPARATKP